MFPLRKIVSGGQTGVDRGALDAALAAGFPCGGWVPPGRLAEDGPIAPRYPVMEMASGGFAARTLQNVLDSDGTAILHFGDLEGGTSLTAALCRRHGRPYRVLDASRQTPVEVGTQLQEFVTAHRIAVLNIAGPRASKAPQAASYTAAVVRHLVSFTQAAGREPMP